MSSLSITHNSGFFSCSSIALRELLTYYNNQRGLPNFLDRSYQYYFYKTDTSIDVSKIIFRENRNFDIPYIKDIHITSEDREDQFSDYKKINFDDIIPFVEKYFTPSDFVEDRVSTFKKDYDIDYENTCGVFYRGNDKSTETSIADYESFIKKSKRVLEQFPEIKFLVQTDENEFLEEFKSNFSNNTKCINEIDRMDKQIGCVFYGVPGDRKFQHGVDYFSAVLIQSRCKHLITHSGNGGMWAILYRGHANNVYQNLNYEWI